MSAIKFPFDTKAYHVTFRPTNGIPEDGEKKVRQWFREKFAFVLLSMEGSGNSRHSHAIVSYDGTNANLRKMFKRAMDSIDMVYGPAGIKIQKIGKRVFDVVAYLHKEGEPVLVRGFQETWIDECLKAHEKKTVKKDHQVVPSNLVWEYIERCAKEYQMDMDSIEQVRDVLVEMNVNGWVFQNPKRAAQIIKQQAAKVNRMIAIDLWSGLLGLDSVANSIY